MIQIRYKDHLETADIAGHTISEARSSYKAGLGITGKTTAYLNGAKISAVEETIIILEDDDTLVFKKAGNNRLAILVGAAALALTITGGIFAYGFVNSTTTIAATVGDADFASVTANTSSIPSWTSHGMQKGNTGSGTLFDIDTATSGYNGDFVVTVSLANAGDVVKAYRMLVMNIEIRDSANNLVDINQDGFSDDADYLPLTLDNGSVALSVKQSVVDVYTVKLRNGYFTTNVKTSGWAPEDGAPMLFCEVSQK